LPWVHTQKRFGTKTTYETHGPDGRNAKINIRQTEHKTGECSRPTPVTESWQDGNEPSLFTKGVTVPN